MFVRSEEKYPRVKVEDALRYIDQVKYKFGNQPQVYNDFLDIMKDFKTQSIDAPGLTQRVSNLFKGHPELIVGFNIFLPPGYKIEVQANDQGSAYQVSVSVPSPSGSSHIIQQPAVNLITHTNHPQNLHVQSQATVSTTNTMQQPTNQQATIADAAGNHRIGQPMFQPVQFNQAIVYVNKVKFRFQEQPEKYKHFLRILHKYNCGSSLTEVFKQVANLFDNQEDLLKEFQQFFPDATPPAYQVSVIQQPAVNLITQEQRAVPYPSTEPQSQQAMIADAAEIPEAKSFVLEIVDQMKTFHF